MRTFIAFFCASLIYLPVQAAAEDYTASSGYRLFSQICLRGLADPKDIRATAESYKLMRVTDAGMLNTLVGPSGNGGAAWVIPRTYSGTFFLSLRPNGTCAIWSEGGDPKAAEDLFRKMVTGAAHTGATLTTDEDQNFTTATGKARLLVMSVESKTAGGYQFTFMAGDRPGAFFNEANIQFSMQMRRLPGKNSPN